MVLSSVGFGHKLNAYLQCGIAFIFLLHIQLHLKAYIDRRKCRCYQHAVFLLISVPNRENGICKAMMQIKCRGYFSC